MYYLTISTKITKTLLKTSDTAIITLRMEQKMTFHIEENNL